MVSHKPAQTTPEERRRYTAEGQQDFGWENPKHREIRDAVARRALRTAEAKKRGDARVKKGRKR
jgi:hypothetical protein